jgi:DNA-binding beta-propeller fold protein YncE
VTPIELATNAPGAEIKVGGEPYAVAITPSTGVTLPKGSSAEA